MAPTSASTPVNLAALRAAVRPVVALYERFLADASIDLVDLEVALRALRALPPMGGDLGRAVALVAAGGRRATTEETIAALERLRTSAGLRQVAAPPPVAAQAVASAATRGRPEQRTTQPRLPGIDRR